MPLIFLFVILTSDTEHELSQAYATYAECLQGRRSAEGEGMVTSECFARVVGSTVKDAR